MKFIETVPVLLCGGEGKRLWPLSRKDLPKQFVKLFDGQSLFDAAVLRAVGLETSLPMVCVTTVLSRFLVADALENLRHSAEILVEPLGKNTTAAICSAAFWMTRTDKDPVMIVLPCDQIVENISLFKQAIDAAVEAAQTGQWILLGIKPDYASDLYGYIRTETGDNDGQLLKVEEFTEKPCKLVAEHLLEDGCLWNAGVFVVRASVVLGTIKKYQPDVFRACQKAVEKHQNTGQFFALDEQSYFKMPSVQLDKAIIQKMRTTQVVPFTGKWSDVGSFDALAKFGVEEKNGNRIIGNAVTNDSENLFIHSVEPLTVTMGVHDLTIVNTPDALLVAHNAVAHKIAPALEKIKNSGLQVSKVNQRVLRPWGYYEIISELANCKVKRVLVHAGACLSSQFHYHRAEHWVITSGTATITSDGETFELNANESVFIPQKVIHRLANETKEPLELIEVQTGEILLEEDIVRLDDIYGREIFDKTNA